MVTLGVGFADNLGIPMSFRRLIQVVNAMIFVYFALFDVTPLMNGVLRAVDSIS